MKALVFLLLFLFLASCTYDCVDKACFDDSCFEIEIPRTSEEINKGLMFREYLPEHEGMLFIFEEEDKHGFWMKNTLIPLDIIWLNKELEVVHIETMIPCTEDPCHTYIPERKALYALEINAGFAEEKGIVMNSKATISFCD